VLDLEQEVLDLDLEVQDMVLGVQGVLEVQEVLDLGLDLVLD